MQKNAFTVRNGKDLFLHLPFYLDYDSVEQLYSHWLCGQREETGELGS